MKQAQLDSLPYLELSSLSSRASAHPAMSLRFTLLLKLNSAHLFSLSFYASTAFLIIQFVTKVPSHTEPAAA